MNIVAEFDPTTQTSGNFTANTQDGSKLLVINESNVNIRLNFPNGAQTQIPANDRRFYGLWGQMSQPNSYYTWTSQSLINDANTINQVVVEVYDPGEDSIELYPSPVIRQSNVGNSIPLSASTNQIVNTGNPPLTNIITVKPSDATSNTWTADNSGNLSISSDNVGTLTTLIQLIAGASPAVKLAAASIITELLGGLKVDGTSSLDNGAITTDGSGDITIANGKNIQWLDTGAVARPILFASSANNTILRAPGGTSGQKIELQDEASTIQLTINDVSPQVAVANNLAVTGTISSDAAKISSDGAGTLTVVKANFNIGGIKDINAFAFSASGTVNHGLSGIPAAILLCPKISGSTWTFSAANYTTTQFTATINTANTTEGFAYR